MTYRESIDWLFSTQMFGIKLGLDGPRRLLKECLAYPASSARVIHVAGTNGKGSTCAMIDSVARAGGTRCGLFTSPHLVDFRERIRVGGAEIPEDACAERLTELREICERLDPHPTFFEIALALAMRWFRERECELIVLETGMGGRLDATTAVPADVCAITPIGLDHAQWLGDTVEKIAVEKAGIFVEGKPALSAPQPPGVRRVLEMEANERRAPLEFIDAPLRGYPLGLAGEHQAWNAALALECLHRAGQPLSFETVHHGLAHVRWPGRFERCERAGEPLIFDGAHNSEAARALAATWRQTFGDRRACLLFSAVSGKDLDGLVAELEPLAAEIHLCALDTPRALDLDTLRAAFSARGDVRVHADLGAAVDAVSGSDLPVLVAGSLFLVGAVRARLAGTAWRASAQ
jgi:dihydrofolate synthase/folylpolyglutamate synthase